MQPRAKKHLSIDESTVRELTVVDGRARDGASGRDDAGQSPTPGRMEDADQGPTPGRMEEGDQGPTPGRMF